MDIPQVIRDKNDAYWLFWVYQGACMLSMTSWARKKNKGKLLKSIDEIIGNVDKKNCKSLQNVNPMAFKNIIEMLNAIDGNGQEFKEEGVIVGYRDLNDTACPGKELYKKLGDIRRFAYDGA